jgi:hypothetical protein
MIFDANLEHLIIIRIILCFMHTTPLEESTLISDPMRFHSLFRMEHQKVELFEITNRNPCASWQCD